MHTPDRHDLAWRASSYSAGQGNCVEVARTSSWVLFRDTKDRAGGTLSLPGSAFAGVLAVVR